MNTDSLVFQAKSFYNAYIALERIHLTCDNPTHYLSPMIVNGAFSIEITLKAILAKNQIAYDKEHHLVVLFQMLPETFKNELLGYLVEKAPEYKDPDKFAEEFLLISNAFADWRYVFENGAPAIDIRFLSAFANAAICTMFSHYNIDYIPSVDAAKTDEAIEELFRQNRETYKSKNILAIQKKMENLQVEAGGEET